MDFGRFGLSDYFLRKLLLCKVEKDDTFHELYSSIILAANRCFEAGEHITVEIEYDCKVELGNGPKTWSKNHSKVLFGEIKALEKYMASPKMHKALEQRLRFLCRLHRLVNMRLMQKFPIHLPEFNIKIPRLIRVKVWLVNKIPLGK